MEKIIFLEPVFKQMIWGGNRLRTDWNFDIPGDDTGECWAISAHSNGDCIVLSGEYRGKTLSELWISHRELFGNVDGDRYPLLVKIIDAKDDLSIQVHPDDTYANLHENGSLGKTECWYILDAKEGSELVVGHNAKTREELESMIKEGKWNDFIRTIPIKKGDFIQITPGTVHAIKGGILLLETQQNSDITYRVYDYDRLKDGKPRELHIQKSIDVITVPAKSVEDSILSMPEGEKNVFNTLIDCEFYKVWKVIVDQKMSIEQKYPFMNVTVLDGSGSIDGQVIKKGDSFILTPEAGKMTVTGNVELMISTL